MEGVAQGSDTSTPIPLPAPDAPHVRAAIQSAIHYPRLAREQGIHGTVHIRFRIDASGMPRELSIVVSAGPLLDDAAREAVRRAAPFQSAPGWVRVPVDFSLRDGP
jgi:periplasmic protein TonB